MAESYRGLTVRIGGDVTGLQKALNAANGAVTGAAQGIRKMQDTLKFDPSNVEALVSKIGFMGEKAEATAMKLRQLKDAQEDLGGRDYSRILGSVESQDLNALLGTARKLSSVFVGYLDTFDGLGEKIREMEKNHESVAAVLKEIEASGASVSINAEITKKTYSLIIKSLNEMHDKMTDLAKEAAEVELPKLKNAISDDTINELAGDFEKLSGKFKKAFASIPDALRSSDFGSIEAELHRIVEIYNSAGDNVAKQNEAIKEMIRLRDEMLSPRVYNADSGNVDMRTITSDLKEMKDILNLDDDLVKSFLTRLKTLKENFVSVDRERERANLLQQAQDLNSEVMRTEALIKNISAAIESMQSPTQTMAGMYELTQNVNILDNSFKELKASISTLGTVMKVDPSNMQAIELALNDIANAEMTVVEESRRIKAELEQYDTAEIMAYADANKSLSQQLFDQAVQARNATESYEQLRGEQAALVRELQQLESASAKDMPLKDEDVLRAEYEELQETILRAKDVTDEQKKSLEELGREVTEVSEVTAEYNEKEKARAKRLEEVRERLDQVKGELADSKRAADEAEKALEMTKARAEIDNLSHKLVEVESRAESLATSARKLGETLAEAAQAKGIERMFGDTQSVVDGFVANFSAALSRADVFSNAFSISPDNFDLAMRSAQALSDAIEESANATTALTTAMDRIDASRIEEVRAKYGTIDAAVVKTAEEVTNLTVRLKNAQAALSQLISNAGLGSMRAEIEDVSKPLEDLHVNAKLKKSITDARDEVARLMSALSEARDAAAEAAQVQQWQSYDQKLTEVQAHTEQLRKKYEELGRTIADAVQTGVIERMFKESDRAIDSFTTTMKSAADSAKVFSDAFSTVMPGYDSSHGYFDSLTASINAAENATAELVMSMKKVDEFEVDELRMKYGSVEEAIESTRGTLEGLVSDTKSAKTAFAELIKKEGVEELSGALLDLSVPIRRITKDFDLSESILKARKELITLNKELNNAREAAEKAAIAGHWQEQQKKLAALSTEVEKISKLMAESSSLELREDAFKPIYDEVARYNESINDAVKKAKLLKEALEARPNDSALKSEYESAVALAKKLAELKSEYISTFTNGVRFNGADEIVAEFGSVSRAVLTLRERLVETQQKMSAIRTQVKALAKEEGISDEKIQKVLTFTKNLRGLTPEIRKLRDDLKKLSSEELEIKPKLDNAELAKMLEEFELDAKTAIGKVEKDIGETPVKLKVEFDDSFVEEYKKKLKEIEDIGFENSGFDETLNKIRLLSEAIDDGKKRLDEYAKAIKLEPKNTELVAKALELASQQTALLKERAELANKAFADLRNSGNIDSVALDTGKVAAKLKEAKENAERFSTEQEQLAKKIKEVVNAINALKAGEDDSELQGQLDDLKNRLEDVRSKAEAAREELETMSNTSFMQGLSDDVAKANNEMVGSVNTINEAAEKTEEADAALRQFADRIIDVARDAAQRIVESAEEIDAAYRDMRKTVDGTEAQFEALRDSAIAFSQTSIVSASEILEMESLGGQLGIAVENLQEFGEVASNLTIATDIGAEDIALELGQLTNIMKDLSETTFDNVGDALVRLGNNTATTESKIMDVAQRLASVASVTGMSTPKLLGWSAAIASTGQNAESAATAISRTITGIGAAVSRGGETLQAFAEIANMTAEEFAETWKTSSSDALEAFVKGLAALTDDSTAAIDALDSVGISSVRQETALLALSQTIGNVDEAMRYATEGFNGGGDAAREAAQKSEGFSGAIGILRNNIDNLAASFGDQLIPFIKLASSILNVLTDVFNALPGPVQASITSILALTAALSAMKLMIAGIKTEELGEMIGQVISTLNFDNIKESIAGVATGIKGMGTLIATLASEFSAAAAGSGGFAAGMEAVGTALKDAAASGSVFATVLNTIPQLLAVGAVLTGIFALIDAFNDWREHSELVESATRSLSDAMGASDESIRSYVASLSGASKSIDEIKASTDSFLESQAGLMESIEGALTNAGERSATLEFYVTKLKELSASCDGSEASIRILQSAIDDVNDAAGTNITIIDRETGQISMQADALDVLTEAFKRNAEAQAWKDAYSSAVEKQIEAEVKLATVKRERAEVEDRLANGEYANLFEQAELRKKLLQYIRTEEEVSATLETQKANVEAVTDAYEEASEHVASITSQMKTYSDAVSAAGQNIDAFNNLSDEEKERIDAIQASLSDVGKSLTDYGTLTKEQLADIASNWTGDVDEIVAYIERLVAETADGINELSDEAKEHINALVEERKKAYEDEYEQRKRDLDDYYEYEKRKLEDKYTTPTKRAIEKEYEDRKRQADDYYSDEKSRLDSIYEHEKSNRDKIYEDRKEQLDDIYEYEKRLRDDAYTAAKNDLDDRYEAEKRARDDAYSDMKSQLDSYYEYEKQARDDAYSAMKDQLDDYYDAEKSARDKAYNQWKEYYNDLYEQEKSSRDKAYENQKETLDKLYDEAKDKSDDWLSDYKDALDAEVEAFKDATDAKMDAMKEEYDLRRELIEEELSAEEAYYNDLISQIEAEQDADDAAKKQASQAAKLASLEAAVAAAESAEERAKAEKELAEYKSELAYEERKNERKRMIDELKDLKAHAKEVADQKKEQLQEQYESELAAYKEARENELEELKKANESEYEELRKKEEEKLAIIKQGQEGQLESLKSQHTSELEEIKKRYDEELATKKETYDQELELIKQSNDSQLEQMKQQNDSEFELIKQQNDSQLLELKRRHDDELTEIKRTHESELLELKRANDDSLSEVKRSHEAELSELKSKNDSELAVIKANQEAELLQYKRHLDDQLTLLKQSQEDVSETTKRFVDDELEKVKRANEDELAELKKKHEAALVEYRKSLEEMKSTTDEKTEAVNKSASNMLNDKVRSGVSNAVNKIKDTVSKGFEAVSNATEKNAKGIVPTTAKTVNDADNTNLINALTNVVARSLKDSNEKANPWAHWAGTQLVYGIAEGAMDPNAQNALRNAATYNANEYVNTYKAVTQTHSPSGVMRKLGVFLPQGLALGIDDGNKYVVDAMRRMAYGLDTGIDFDVTQEIIDRMREQEDKLLAQVRKMSDIIEQGFDPQLTVSAAYEAIDEIEQGELRRSMRVAAAQQTSTVTNAPVINITIAEVSVREQADITLISETIARNVRRELVATLR